MDNDFLKNLSLKNKIDAERAKQYKEISKERLLKIAITKVRTTMIGALDIMEKKLKQFWTPDVNQKATSEQLILAQMYQDIRKDILDKGNQQIRNLEAEFEQYEIEWKRYTLNLPVKNKEQ